VGPVADAFNLSDVFIHLGVGSTATPLPDFAWSPEYLVGYQERFAADGAEGRLICVMPQEETWDSWERHPAGDEVVVLLSGRVDLVQDLDGAEHVVELQAGQAVINPAGVWHTARVHDPGVALFVTPGRGTEAKPLG
jgi:mannose-6-phosphate isomerase-like protein (cupin superfamily)